MREIGEDGAINMLVSGPTGTLSRIFGWNYAHDKLYKNCLEIMYNYNDETFYYLEEIQDTTEEREIHDATYYRNTFIDGKYICETQQPHIYGIICAGNVKEITNDEIDVCRERNQKVFIIREVRLTNRGKDLAKDHIDERNKVNKQLHKKKYHFFVYYKDKILDCFNNSKIITAIVIMFSLYCLYIKLAQ